MAERLSKVYQLRINHVRYEEYLVTMMYLKLKNKQPNNQTSLLEYVLHSTADFMFALISSEELEKNQITVKQLKNRYNDPTINRKFILGVDSGQTLSTDNKFGKKQVNSRTLKHKT